MTRILVHWVQTISVKLLLDPLTTHLFINSTHFDLPKFSPTRPFDLLFMWQKSSACKWLIFYKKKKKISSCVYSADNQNSSKCLVLWRLFHSQKGIFKSTQLEHTLKKSTVPFSNLHWINSFDNFKIGHQNNVHLLWRIQSSKKSKLFRI